MRPILEAVRKRGDKALLEYARKFDNFERKSRSRAGERAEGGGSRSSRRLSQSGRDGIGEHPGIRGAADAGDEDRDDQRPAGRLGQIVRPLDTVAAYIPAGRYPLPSTLMMTVIPAQVAGVPNICVDVAASRCRRFWERRRCSESRTCSRWAARRPSRRLRSARGRFRARTASSGPGNIYVAAAKKLLAGEVGIDFVAGPDGDPDHRHRRRAAWIAADMLAQAEHDVDASAILLTTSKRLAQAVAKEIERQLADLPTGKVARKAIDKNSAIIAGRID